MSRLAAKLGDFPLAIMLASVSLGFSAGLWAQEVRCANDVAVLRAQFIAHTNLSIHPGAATSEVVRALELRIVDLEHRLKDRR